MPSGIAQVLIISAPSGAAGTFFRSLLVVCSLGFADFFPRNTTNNPPSRVPVDSQDRSPSNRDDLAVTRVQKAIGQHIRTDLDYHGKP